MSKSTEKIEEQEEQLFIRKTSNKKKTKLTNLEILELHARLKNLPVVNGIKLNHAINRTVSFLKDLAEEMGSDKKIPVLEDFKTYEKELQDAYKDLTKNKDGNPTNKVHKTDRGEVEELNFDLNSQQAIDVRAKIQAKHKKAIEKRLKQADLYNEWLREESEDDYKLYYIPVSIVLDATDVPKEVWDAITPLIKEMTPDQEKEWNDLFEKLK